jgi:anionic cell wall polymer biosynthesis LytR-Cps2A-Psr (LCP) family protein
MGGIEINVEKQMDYDDNYQNLYIHLKPGLQVLNGREAMGYVRFRHDFEGDYGRMRRQDQFLRALVAQINKPEVKSRLPQMLGPMVSMMKTDLTLNDIRTLKDIAGKIGFDGMYTAQLPTTPGMKGKASVVEVLIRRQPGRSSVKC